MPIWEHSLMHVMQMLPISVQQLSSAKFTGTVISSLRDIGKFLNLRCPSQAVLPSGWKMHAEDAVLADAFQTHRLPPYLFPGMWRISHWVITQTWCWGPWTHALDYRAGAEQTLLPTTYLYRIGTICPAGMFVQMVHFAHKVMVWGSPLVSAAE